MKREDAGLSPARVLAHVLDMVRIKAENPSFDFETNYIARPAINASEASKEGPSVYRFLPRPFYTEYSKEDNKTVQKYARAALESLSILQILRFSDGKVELSFDSPYRVHDFAPDDLGLVAQPLYMAGLNPLAPEGHLYLDSTSFYVACLCAVYWLNLNESFFSSVFARLRNREAVLQVLRLHLAAFTAASQRLVHQDADRCVLNHIVKAYISNGILDVFDNVAVKSYLRVPSRTDEEVAAALNSIKAGLPDFASNKGPAKYKFGDFVYAGLSVKDLSNDDISKIKAAHGNSFVLDDSYVYLKCDSIPDIFTMYALDKSVRPNESRKFLLRCVAETDVIPTIQPQKGPKIVWLTAPNPTVP